MFLNKQIRPKIDPKVDKYLKQLLQKQKDPQPQTQQIPQNENQYIFLHDGKSPVDQILMMVHPDIFIKRLLGETQKRNFVALCCTQNQMTKFMEAGLIIKEDLQVEIIIVKNIVQLTQLTQKYQNIVLICPPQYIKSVQRLADKNQIRSVICYPCQQNEDYICNNNKFTQAYSQIDLKDIIINNQQQKNTNFKTLPNFMYWPIQTFQFNLLHKSLSFCLQHILQEDVRILIIDQFEKLINNFMKVNQEICKHKQKIQQFLDKLRKGNLSPEQAIYWYTFDSPIYKLINNILRCARNTLQMLYVQPYIFDLFRAIRSLQNNNKEGDKNRFCYRGGLMQQKQIKLFIKNIGKKVSNLGFLSTSGNQQLARKYIKNVFFKIQLTNITHRHISYAEIKKISEYFEEQEILFNILSDFIITDVQTKIQDNKKVYYIKLKVFNSEHEQFPTAQLHKGLLYFDAPLQIQLEFDYSPSKQKYIIALYNQISRKANLSSLPLDHLICNQYQGRICYFQQQLQKFITVYESSLCLMQKLQYKQKQYQLEYQKHILLIQEQALTVFNHFGQFDKIKQVISYLEKMQSQKMKIDIKLKLCKAYFILTNFEKSMQFFNQAIYQLQQKIQNENNLQVQQNLVQVKLSIFYDYNYILVACKPKENTINTIQTHSNINCFFASEYQKALFYQEMHKTDNAIQICQQLLKNLVLYQTTNFKYLSKILMLLSRLLTQKKNFNLALYYLNDKLLPIVIKKQGKKCWNYCKTISLIADCYFQMHRKQQAKYYYKLYFKYIQLNQYIHHQIEDQYDTFLYTMAKAYDRVDNIEMAIQTYVKYGQYILNNQKNQQHDNYVKNFAHLASCYFRQGNISQAMKCYQNYQKIVHKKYQKLKMLNNYITDIRKLANLSQEIGLHSKQLYYTKKVLQILKQQQKQNKKQIMFQLIILASAYYNNHKVQQSISCYEQIFKMLISFNKINLNLCFLVAQYYYDIGNYHKSVFFYQKSVQNIIKNQQIQMPFLIIKSIKMLIYCYVNIGQYIQNFDWLIQVVQSLIDFFLNQRYILIEFQQVQKQKLFQRIQKLKIDKCQDISFCDM